MQYYKSVMIDYHQMINFILMTQNQVRLSLGCVALVASLFYWSPELCFGQDSSNRFQPILPLDTSYQASTLGTYVGHYFSDDFIEITNQGEFNSTLETFDSLAATTSQSPSFLTKRLYTALSLKYYLDRLGARGLNHIPKVTALSGMEVKQLYSQLKSLIMKDTSYLVRKSRKHRALFHYYRMTSGAMDDVALNSLKKILNDKNAPPALKFKVYYQLLYFGLQLDQNLLDLNKIRSFEKRYYRRAKVISKESHVMAALALAAAYAGVKDGVKVRSQTDPRYREFLQQASTRIDRVDPELKQQVLSEILTIWFMASSGSPNYQNPPFSTVQLLGTPVYEPIIERIGLSKLKKSLSQRKQLSVAERRRLLSRFSQTYKKLAMKDDLNQYHHRIYRKLLDEHYFLYQEKGDNGPLAKEIWWQIRQLERSQRSAPLDQHLQFVKKAYTSLIDQEGRRALLSNTKEKSRRDYLMLVDSYIKRMKPESTQLAKLFEAQGAVYVKLKHYSKAVRFFTKGFDLVNDDNNMKIRLIDLAIHYQHLLSGWPKKPQWNQIKNSDLMSTYVKQLANLYQKKLALITTESPQSHQVI
ncbi:MAG: hypothetical protein OXC40_06280, partial [Proteobacteria bacterium]|nr:hypothetical protein [Pseudomonadota bacterium]